MPIGGAQARRRQRSPRESEPGRPMWWSFALVVYGPLLLIDRGKVVADTKSYLYLDPSRLLTRATSMWDPQIGLGTTSHQNIGYLFPMGPYYWLMERALHVPAWVAQRFWLGTLLFAAGMGMRYLLRTLDVEGPGVPVAMLAYAFTPYVIEYSTRLSVLLGPWAALPWFVAFAARALQKRGWRYPALFALTVQLVGGVNATALIYALIGPAVFVVYEVLVTRASDWRRVWSAVWRTGLLTFVTSLWWLSGLWVESRYGLDVLRYTEKIKDVSATSYPFEVVRGLGYWMLYGRDPVSFWNHALLGYTLTVSAVLVSLLVPAVALLAAVTARWRDRLYFVLLVVVGVATAVAATPYDHPSIAGAAFKSFASGSTLGLALRSTSRATPLVVLGFAALLAAGINAFADRMRAAGRPQVGMAAAFVIGALCLANALSPLRGSYYTAYLERGPVPHYWTRALTDADAGPHDTRLLSLPGTDFAAYRWGDTIDPIEPGLIDRPFIARELVPFGSDASANLLQALDRRLQEKVLDPDAVAPIARLMAVGDVLLRLDLQTDRFHLVSATDAWRLFTADQPRGLTAPRRYGTKVPGRPVDQGLSGLVAALSGSVPPPVAMFSVTEPEPIMRALGADAPVVVAGDGEGLVDLASAGLLDARRPILYAGSYATRPDELRALPNGAVLVLTDSNRRRAQRGVMANGFGYTEAAGEKPLAPDTGDQRIEVFPDASDASRTVDVMSGVRSVQATSYGSIFGYTPARRPAAAFDGDVDTAWEPSGGKNERLVLRLAHPITTDHITFVQPRGTGSLYIDQVGLRFDGAPPIRESLNASSQAAAGQTVRFPRRSFSTLEIRIDSEYASPSLTFATKDRIGLAEVRVGDDAPGAQPVRVTETMRLPTDLLDVLGESSQGHPLVIVVAQENTMDQAAMRREFTLPTKRSFSISGTVTLSSATDDGAIDRALGVPDAEHGGFTATSSVPLNDPRARASSAIDGDPTTAWNAPVGNTAGARVHVELPTAQSIDHLDLQFSADGSHSMATQLRIEGGDGTRLVNLAQRPVSAQRGVDAVRVDFAPLHGRIIDVTIAKAETLIGPSLVAQRVGIAELGIPGVRRAPVPARLPGACVAGLLTIDGRPTSVRVTGSTDDALRGRPLSLSGCGPANPATLAPGRHRLVAQLRPENPNGLAVQRLVLASAAGGAAGPASALMTMAPTERGPAVRVQHQSRTSMTVRVGASSHPYWLVLGQSVNRGWHAKIDGHDLGAPRLVNGYANGWLVPSGAAARAVTVGLEWEPQRVVWVALWLSLAGGVGCLLIIGATTRARRRRMRLQGADPAPVASVVRGSITARPPLLETSLSPRSKRGVAVAVGILALTAAVLSRPWVGLLVGGLAYWSLRDRRVRLVVRYAPAVIIAGVAVYMAGAQALHHYATGTEWPLKFASARTPTWIALLLLLTDAVIERSWRSDESSP